MMPWRTEETLVCSHTLPQKSLEGKQALKKLFIFPGNYFSQIYVTIPGLQVVTENQAHCRTPSLREVSRQKLAAYR
jgi:hypothetical protein